MTFVSDSTSLILLAKIGLLELFVTKNNVVIPLKVYEEVIKGRDKGRLDAYLVEKLAAEKKIVIKVPHGNVTTRIEKLFNIHGGELQVIALALAAKNTIMTDDKKCLNAAKAMSLNFINSLDVVLALSKKGSISKETAVKLIGNLEEYGWYSKDFIKKYKEALK